jgi:hypothetical protein
MASALTAPARQTQALPRRSVRGRRSRQRTLFCQCGQAIPAIAGLCRSCYRARCHSRAKFEGHREAVLARDRACQGCGAGKSRLHVHHRQPGLHEPAWLITLCAACHARVHRLGAIRCWLPERLVELWAEQHQSVPMQLQFPAVPERVGGA